MTYSFLRFYNLFDDPKEEYPLTTAIAGDLGVQWPIAELINEHGSSLKSQPPIEAGTPDHYAPV